MKKQLYSNLREAMIAAQALGIKSSYDYKHHHKKDPLLPATPQEKYAQEWKGWPYFLNVNEKLTYNSLEEASKAAIKLNIRSCDEYIRKYSQDPLLRARPHVLYKNEWESWPSFLKTKRKLYKCFQAATTAARRLNAKSCTEYKLRYKEDEHLPNNPIRVYGDEWKGWSHFLGREDKKTYRTLIEASSAARKLGIKSSNQYVARYKCDPYLPPKPEDTYKTEWIDWYNFLGKEKKRYYPTLTEAKTATQRLGITSQSQYKTRYKEDPYLPSNPHYMYASEWDGYTSFFGHRLKKSFYKSIEEATLAALRLGLTSSSEYRKHYLKDPRLCSTPEQTYKSQWKDWPHFLGQKRRQIYPSISEASSSAKKLNIKDKNEYTERYREDLNLPACPNQYYRDNWKGWAEFLGQPKKTPYQSIDQASQAAQRLEIKNSIEYKLRYREDTMLPNSPKMVYQKEWISWRTFLGLRPNLFYESLQEASEAALRLGIRSSTKYKVNYKKDSLLPSNPHKTYESEWKSWKHFFGESIQDIYPELHIATKAVRKLRINSVTEYLSRYIEDPHLPRSPHKVYKQSWITWPHFLGFYPTLSEVKRAVQQLDFQSKVDYKKGYIQDSRLPPEPHNVYRSKWTNYNDFLLPDCITTVEQLKKCCSILNVQSCLNYRKIRASYPQLPAKPERFLGWSSWYDVLDIPKPYTYLEIKTKAKEYGCHNSSDYMRMRKELNDPRMPSRPESYYKEWTNAFDFYGKKRPYRVKYLTQDWMLWGEYIKEFLKVARGGDTKAKDLCEFVREYIEPNRFEKNPLEFLTRGKTDIQPMLELFTTVRLSRKKKWLYSIKEFLDWILIRELVLEDESTGEISFVKNAKNPFSHISFDDEKSKVVINETSKLALPYQFVKDAREWIFPNNSQPTYQDLKHLHIFPADWQIIEDISVLDPNDPDCVVKRQGDRTYLWVPTYWTYTFALMHLPARGQQIVYCDSGEADAKIAEIVNGKVIWVKNKSKLAGLTDYQGMISKIGDDYGVKYTTNKTHFDGKGYSVPFMPEELVHWLIKLRKWQEKYNPISTPTTWLSCERTNLNETQRRLKGSNCFLFRNFNEQEPGTFSGRLADRLAASLFFSGKSEINNSTFDGQSYNDCYEALVNLPALSISKFKSPYTPHSMRVSLINAYAYEFGLPMEVIMKLVGHSSIMMTIYYTKADNTGANIREKLERGEKEAIKEATKSLKKFIESKRIEECKKQLTSNSPEFLASLDNSRPPSSYQFKDFGICPVGSAYCNEGGDAVAVKANIYHPVPSGYLGEQNCIKCRFFVTGPAFLIGLTAIFNEVSLSINIQAQRHSQLEKKLTQLVQDIDVISHRLYERKRNKIDVEVQEIELKKKASERHKLNSEIETKAKKIDLFLSDLNFLHKHIRDCQTLIRNQRGTDTSKLQLIVPETFTLSIELSETSSFYQLSEVCENAEIYHSCSDDLAIARRSQALDKMLIANKMQPYFMFLNEEEQLKIGNQLTQLMLKRLESWDSLEHVIEGSVALSDLDEKLYSTTQSIKKLLEISKQKKLEG